LGSANYYFRALGDKMIIRTRKVSKTVFKQPVFISAATNWPETGYGVF